MRPTARVSITVIFLTPGFICLGQTALLQQDAIITGQCTGRGSEPGCVLPTIFGPGGLTLFNSPTFPHFAHFAGSAQNTLNVTLSSAIATQLTVLPIISPSSGLTYRYDKATGAFVRTTTSFGPIYTERAETIGRGKVSFGVSYQRFHFSSIDGIDLHNIPAVFGHIPGTAGGGATAPFESDVIQTSNSVDLHMDQTMLYGTFGITDRLDVSVALPIVSVRMGASSAAKINRVSGDFLAVAGVGQIANPHSFSSDPNALTNVFSSTGNASGIGDVTFRVKANVYRGEHIRAAAAMDVRTPTGDARQLLGSGATGLKPFIALSTPGRISPHMNLGYQWNGSSILAGDVTGTTVFEDTNPATGLPAAFYRTGPAVKRGLPGNFFYSTGVEIGATRRLTLVFDYLGQVLFDAPRVVRTTTTVVNPPGGTGPATTQTLPTISGGKSNVGLNSGAAGLKYNLGGSLLLSADILFRLDNKGLRQDVTPLIALSYSFGQ